VYPALFKLPSDTALGFNTESNEEKEKEVGTEEDVLDLIRSLPQEINDLSTTTEFKFLTVGGVLWACYDEIKRLREEVAKLKKSGRRR
jgi:hypothetical protein